MEAIDIIRQSGLVPTVSAAKTDRILPVLGALLSGGLSAAEIDFHAESAADCLKIGCMKFPDMTIGACGILTGEDAKTAADAGARFIVSPGFSDEIEKICEDCRIPYIPGCVTPTEIMNARSRGIELVNFFPAENFGGVGSLKALSAVFPTMSFMPSGGIDMTNLADYLSLPRVAACAGSFMMSDSLDKVAEICMRAAETVEKYR